MNLAFDISKAQVRKGEIAIIWLGQAGFLLKDDEGNQFAIDPYLTDCGERIKGFKRISPKLMNPSQLTPNYYVITHTHFDHFDYDAIPIIASNLHTLFLGPESCIDELKRMGIDNNRCVTLKPGEVFEAEKIRLTAITADHGKLAPDAIGVVLEMGGHCIYFSGDTAYHPEINKIVKKSNPDIAIISINGKFGNMNGVEGGRTANEVGSDFAIPCHFWTFLEHGGKPEEFKEYLEQNNRNSRPVFMRHGEIKLFSKK